VPTYVVRPRPISSRADLCRAAAADFDRRLENLSSPKPPSASRRFSPPLNHWS